MLSKWQMEDAKLARKVGTCQWEHYHFEVAEKHEIGLRTQPCVSKKITLRPARSKYNFLCWQENKFWKVLNSLSKSNSTHGSIKLLLTKQCQKNIALKRSSSGKRHFFKILFTSECFLNHIQSHLFNLNRKCLFTLHINMLLALTPPIVLVYMVLAENFPEWE